MKIFAIFLLLFLSSCQTYMAKIFPERPDRQYDMDPDATPEYRQGFADGCEVGMSAGSNTFYKMFYHSNKVDGYKMANSADYKNAWGVGFWWCYRKDHLKTNSAIWGSTFGGMI